MRLLRSFATLLALSLPLVPDAGAEAASGPNGTVCEAAAAMIKRFADEAYVGKSFDPLSAIARIPHSGIDATTEVTPAPADAADFTRRFRPDHALASRYDALSDDGHPPKLGYLPTSRLYALTKETGAARCQAFGFFAQGADGRAVAFPLPKLTQGDRQYCGQATGELMAISGVPVFTRTEDAGADGETRALFLEPWAGDKWGEPCGMRVRLSARFKVQRRICPRGTDCEQMEALAMQLARYQDAHPDDHFHLPALRGIGSLPDAVASAMEADPSVAAGKNDCFAHGMTFFYAYGDQKFIGCLRQRELSATLDDHDLLLYTVRGNKPVQPPFVEVTIQKKSGRIGSVQIDRTP